MRTSANRSYVLVALLLGCTAIGLFSRSASSQSPAATSKLVAAPEGGRYQLTVLPGVFIIFDTKTARCWRKEGVPNPGTDEAGWEEFSPTWARGK